MENILLLSINWSGICIAAIVVVVIASMLGSFDGANQRTQMSHDAPNTLSLNDVGTYFQVKDLEDEKILLQVGIDGFESPLPERLWYIRSHVPPSLQERGVWFKIINDNGKMEFQRYALRNHTLQPVA